MARRFVQHSGNLLAINLDRDLVIAADVVRLVRRAARDEFHQCFSHVNGIDVLQDDIVREEEFFLAEDSFDEILSAMHGIKWAFDNGKLKKVQGTEKKKVQL